MAKRQQAQIEIQKFFLNINPPHTLFHHEGGQALAQVAQSGYGVSILVDIQSPAGHGPEQPACR